MENIDINRLQNDPQYWKELGAPNDATHFAAVGDTPSVFPFEKVVNNQWWFWDEYNKHWSSMPIYGENRYDDECTMIPRPAEAPSQYNEVLLTDNPDYVRRLLEACGEPEAPWDGTGAPTVGQTVKYLRDDREEFSIPSPQAWKPGDEIEVIQIRQVNGALPTIVIGWNKRLESVNQRLVELDGPLFGPLYEPVESLTPYQQLLSIIIKAETANDAAEAIIRAGFDLVGGAGEPVQEPEEPEMPKDLEWLARHLKTMPPSCYRVRLDCDGEVLFEGAHSYDYYPEKELEADRYGSFGEGYYTVQEINEARAKL